MIGIVVVSHSPRLAQAAVDLALEMVGDGGPAIAIAAGAGEGVTGTDAVKVAEAITEVSSPDGVLVMMDLGSAVMSSEMALEFLADPEVTVRLTAAPFVEGLIAAVVSAAGGASLDDVDREARGALNAKRAHLGDGEQPGPWRDVGPVAEHSIEMTLANPNGLHARPAAMLVKAIGAFEATVTVANLRTGRPPVPANSPTALLGVGAGQGDTISVAASGRQAREALEAVAQLVRDGFGELETAAVATVSEQSAALDTAAPPDERPSNEGPSNEGPSNEGLPSGPIGVSPGIAVGPIVRMPVQLEQPVDAPVLSEQERSAAVVRIEAASASVASALQDRASRVSGPAREILEATALMANDPGLIGDACARVTDEGKTPERAVWAAAGDIAAMFTDHGGLLAARVPDLHDVRGRIVAELLGRQAPGLPERTEPYVLVARDLAPADTALIDPAVCRAIVTVEGGATSHTAIIARALGLPAVVGALHALEIREGSVVIVNGTTGVIIEDPTDEQIVQAEH